MKKISNADKIEINSILTELNIPVNLRCRRSKEEIAEKIFTIKSDSENFTTDSYSYLNGEYELFYSDYKTEDVLKNFVNWLFNDDTRKM